MALPAHDAESVLERMVNAVERARQRLLNASNALHTAGIDYVVAGDCAVAAWVATIDEAAVRNTQDVDLLIRRDDFAAAKSALESAGFTYRKALGLDLFLDTPTASPRSAVHLVFAEKIVKPGELAANPAVEESTDLGAFRVINLDALVRIKLTAHRDKDRTHLRDLIGVGLIDRSWIGRLPPILAERLRRILDTPDG